VSHLTTSAATLGEAGLAPRFTAAVRAGTLALTDATCPAVHTALQAAEKGVPFLPLRGLIGSDLLAARPDWRVIDNPFSEAPDPIVLIPALAPDVALIHAVAADRAGNVWVGRRRELATIAHASKVTLVTVERLVDGDLTEDETMAPGVISSLYVSAVAVAERGAWPLGLLDLYAADQAALDAYAREARTEEGFRAWLAATFGASLPRAAA
jgi:glutaconate CoA-transferase subunit A